MKRILILTNPSVTVTRKSKRVILESKEKFEEIKVKEISACLLFGNIQITSQAIRLFADEGIPITNLSFEGEPRYFVLPPGYINYDLKIRQYEASRSPEKRLEIAKFIINQKITNSLNFIKTSKSRNKKISAREIKKVQKNAVEAIKSAKSIDELIGHEGNFTKIYFDMLKEISCGSVRFKQRSKRPPKDEANALLSFIYTLTYSLITGIVFAAGFDPYVGFVHSEDYGRNSFALDVLELYRAPFCDRFFINLTNKNILQPRHFVKSEKGGFLLNNDGKKIFFEHWKKYVYDYDKPSQSIIYNIQDNLTKFSKLLRTGD